MFRATFIIAIFLASAGAFIMPQQVARGSCLFSKKDEIPDAVTQGPEEGQIPAAENTKKGEKTMESLGNQGNKEDNKKED